MIERAQTDNGYVEFLTVSECRPLLRRELENAYYVFAIIEINDLTRMISHQPMAHAPAKKLSWPFSKLQMHDVEIVYYKAAGDPDRKRFKKDKINVAIEEFLSGVPPNHKISINVEFS
jgi:hypothetical protein